MREPKHCQSKFNFKLILAPGSSRTDYTFPKGKQIVVKRVTMEQKAKAEDQKRAVEEVSPINAAAHRRSACLTPTLVQNRQRQVEQMRGFQQAIELLQRHKKPVLAHNGLLDLMFTMEHFWRPLPGVCR